MKTLLTPLLLAASAFGQTATITDTITTPFGGTFSGTVTVSLNSPGLAQPLYSGNITLSGWTQAVAVTSGVFTLTLYTNDLITPGGTSYTATYAPTSGSGWKETWIVPSGATTIREIRSTTVPSPSVRLTPSQITQAGATLGQGLKWDGSKWAPADVVANPMTTNGDLITRLGGVPVRIGIGSTNQVLTVSGGMPVWASGITGNASTATSLAANGTNCSAGSYPLGVDASGNAEGCTVAGGGGGSGTVTSVSVVSANGVSGTVANPTTTPAITLSLGAITPSSVAASGTVTGSNLSGTNTGDQTNIAGNAGTATALAADPANCSAGTLPRGVDASGVGQGCAAVSLTSEVTGTLPNANTTATSSNTGSAIVARDASGNFTAGTVTAALTGNASTATALAVDPAACLAGQFVSDIAANGALTCSTPSGGGGGSGTVTSVSVSTGLLSVANPTTAPDISIAGTSGGVPYFSNSTTLASSAALDAGALVVGGGAGGAPTILANSSVPNAGELRISTTPTPGATRSVFTLGSAITGGGAGANAGTFYALNAPSGFVGDFMRFELNGAAAFAVNRLGTITIGTANTYGSAGVSVSNVGTLAFTNTSAGASAAFRITGSAGTGSGNFLALRPTSSGSGPDVLRINADQRGVMIGQTAETASVSNLSLGVFDDTASTGVTRHLIQKAANQGTVSPFEVRDFNATLGDGALLFEIEPDGSFRSLPTGTRPACASGIRGTYWYTQGGTGVKDAVEVCTKDAADVYAWRVIY